MKYLSGFFGLAKLFGQTNSFGVLGLNLVSFQIYGFWARTLIPLLGLCNGKFYLHLGRINSRTGLESYQFETVKTGRRVDIACNRLRSVELETCIPAAQFIEFRTLGISFRYEAESFI